MGGERTIIHDLLLSIERSFGAVDFDIFLTDDASKSSVGQEVVEWGRERSVSVLLERDEESRGFRGAIERTIRMLRAVARSNIEYDAILRIDSDALVIREGLDRAILASVADKAGLYGVLKKMRKKDAVALLLDLLPLGMKRRSVGARIERDFSVVRLHPVWWWRFGVRALTNSFRFKYVEGPCYVMGGTFPLELERQGLLSRYRPGQHGLITSEEDVMITILCSAAGLRLHALDGFDKTWRTFNSIGDGVLRAQEMDVPYVIHPLKDDLKGEALRSQIMARFQLFQRP